MGDSVLNCGSIMLSHLLIIEFHVRQANMVIIILFLLFFLPYQLQLHVVFNEH